MKTIHAIAFILVIVGGLNWLLVGIGGWDLVDIALGSIAWLAKLVYILVGLSAVYLVVTHKKDCKNCDKGAAPAAPAQM